MSYTWSVRDTVFQKIDPPDSRRGSILETSAYPQVHQGYPFSSLECQLGPAFQKLRCLSFYTRQSLGRSNRYLMPRMRIGGIVPFLKLFVRWKEHGRWRQGVLTTAADICAAFSRSRKAPWCGFDTLDLFCPSTTTKQRRIDPTSHPTWSMHQCLSICEVLYSICDRTDTKADALSLAMTCRTFLEPALDALWREIVLFDPLIACLPGDLWREETVESEAHETPNTILVRSRLRGAIAMFG